MISSDCGWTSCTFYLTSEESYDLLGLAITTGSAVALAATTNPGLIAVVLLIGYYGATALAAELSDQCVSFKQYYLPIPPEASLYAC